MVQNKRTKQMQSYSSFSKKQTQAFCNLSREEKRGKRKCMTQAIVGQLSARFPVNPYRGVSRGVGLSNCSRSYMSAYHCLDQTIPDKETGKLVGKFCKQRMCFVCGSIMSAQLMDGYMPSLEPYMDRLYFVTLTARSPDRQFHRLHLKRMYKEWRKITQRASRQKRKDFKGLRKTEDNPRPDFMFHPHFHVLIVGKDNAYWLLQEWMKSWGSLADRVGQDVRKADKGSLKEMFKYMVKPFVGFDKKDSKGKRRSWKMTDEEVDQLNEVYCALRKKRCIQPFGPGMKKVVEEIDETKLENAIDAPDTEDDVFYWDRSIGNWVGNVTGKLLIDYVKPPPRSLLCFLSSCKPPPCPDICTCGECLLHCNAVA